MLVDVWFLPGSETRLLIAGFSVLHDTVTQWRNLCYGIKRTYKFLVFPVLVSVDPFYQNLGFKLRLSKSLRFFKSCNLCLFINVQKFDTIKCQKLWDFDDFLVFNSNWREDIKTFMTSTLLNRSIINFERGIQRNYIVYNIIFSQIIRSIPKIKCKISDYVGPCQRVRTL